jgi:hypothetical protein
MILAPKCELIPGQIGGVPANMCALPLCARSSRTHMVTWLLTTFVHAICVCNHLGSAPSEWLSQLGELRLLRPKEGPTQALIHVLHIALRRSRHLEAREMPNKARSRRGVPVVGTHGAQKRAVYQHRRRARVPVVYLTVVKCVAQQLEGRLFSVGVARWQVNVVDQVAHALAACALVLKRNFHRVLVLMQCMCVSPHLCVYSCFVCVCVWCMHRSGCRHGTSAGFLLQYCRGLPPHIPHLCACLWSEHVNMPFSRNNMTRIPLCLHAAILHTNVL